MYFFFHYPLLSLCKYRRLAIQELILNTPLAFSLLFYLFLFNSNERQLK